MISPEFWKSGDSVSRVFLDGMVRDGKSRILAVCLEMVCLEMVCPEFLENDKSGLLEICPEMVCPEIQCFW
jgi:hypothetical protein